MPYIREDEQDCRVTAREAEQLRDLGLIMACPGCDDFHHEEYERWDEIHDVLHAIRHTAATPPAGRVM